VYLLIFEFAFIWIFLKADPETKTSGQVVYLEVIPRSINQEAKK
jgi:hypothetical protein